MRIFAVVQYNGSQGMYECMESVGPYTAKVELVAEAEE